MYKKKGEVKLTNDHDPNNYHCKCVSVIILRVNRTNDDQTSAYWMLACIYGT